MQRSPGGVGSDINARPTGGPLPQLREISLHNIVAQNVLDDRMKGLKDAGAYKDFKLGPADCVYRGYSTASLTASRSDP
jgi:hypothetical protein